jgi:hypothetical protein
MWKAIVALAALATLSAGPAASAEASDTTADVRCLVVSLAMLQSTSQGQQTAGLLSFFYFEGRIDGREPNYDLEAGLRREITRMSGEQLSDEAKRCGGILTSRGDELMQIGKHLGDTVPALPSS